MNRTTLSTTGDYIADDSTGTLIKVTNMGGHYSLYVRNGADRVAELCGNYPTADSAKRRAGYLRNALLAGTTVQQLVDETTTNQTSVLAAANQAVDAVRDVEQVRAGINADLDTAHNQRVQAYNAEQGAVRQAIGNTAWTRFAPPRTRPVPTGQRADLSVPQLYALTKADRNGVIRVQSGVGKPTLEALESRGLGTVVRGSARSRNEVIKLVLNTAGCELAGVEVSA